MITGELKSKVDRIWDTMWAGGIANPLSGIEKPIFAEDQVRLLWSRFKELAPEDMFNTVLDQVFLFIQTLVPYTPRELHQPQPRLKPSIRT
jgi:type I restriction enzyme M protein